MKTIIQIVVAVVVVIACARGGEAAWRYYEFKDAVEQEIRFGSGKTTSELRRRVMELAVQHSVAVEYENVIVEPRPGQTFVSVDYVEAIKLVPAIYTRQQQFAFEMTIPAARPLIIDER